MQEFINFLSHHELIVAAIIVLFITLVIIELLRIKRLTVQVSPQQATQLINRENAAIIDVRDAELFKKGHIIDAISMRVEDLKNPPKKFEKYRTKPLIIVCQTGAEAYKIATQLRKQGYNSFSLAGGMRAWLDAQLPLIKDEKNG